MKSRVVLVVVLSIVVFISYAFSEQKTGAENIILEGGDSGMVPFPHKIHQDNLKDCNICHELFGQELGIIEKLKSDERLKAKQIMNMQCLKCHRDTKRAGKASGPTSCATCHSK